MFEQKDQMELLNQSLSERDGSNVFNIKHQKNLENLRDKNNKNKNFGANNGS